MSAREVLFNLESTVEAKNMAQAQAKKRASQLVQDDAKDERLAADTLRCVVEDIGGALFPSVTATTIPHKNCRCHYKSRCSCEKATTSDPNNNKFVTTLMCRAPKAIMQTINSRGQTLNYD